MTYEMVYFQTVQRLEKSIADIEKEIHRFPRGSEYRKELQCKKKTLEEELDNILKLGVKVEQHSPCLGGI